ncbi:EAL domain-containing protein [Segnochrobactraceae bacterium EtOH-i3]
MIRGMIEPDPAASLVQRRSMASERAGRMAGESAVAPQHGREAGAVRRLVHVIDDEPGVRNYLSFALESLGFEAECFADTIGFEQRAGDVRPDLVIMDLAIGDRDAIDLIRFLDLQNYRGPVVLVSGRPEALMRQVQLVGERHGLHMLPMLRKPFRVEDVRRVLVKGNLIAIDQLDAVQIGQALEENRFRLWYQPKIDLASRTLIGVEALLRLDHPEFGLLSPGAFLSAADGPMIARITERVLNQALAGWTQLAAAGLRVPVSINTPVSVFSNLDVPALVAERRPPDPDWPGLIVEIPEDQVVREADIVFEAATRLKVHGIELAIDDFGAGYSSLSRLRQIPFAEIKLDRSLVRECDEDRADRIIVQAVCDMAHHWGARVVAEGVETSGELHTLLGLGCDAAQGFHFARPQPLDQFIGMARARMGGW